MVHKVQFGLRLCAFFTMIFLSTNIAVAEKKTAEDLKSMSPKELIQALDTAPRVKAIAIREMLIDKKENSIPLLRDTILRGTPKQKIFACTLLGEMRDKGAVANLLQVVEDPDVRIKLCGINALRDIGDPNARQKLRKVLDKSKDKGTLICTLIAIGKLGEKSDIKKLQKFIRHSEGQVQTAGAVACAMLGDTTVQNLLIEITYDKDPFSARTAVKGLGYLSTPESADRLQDILTDPNGVWKTDARIALVRQKLVGKPLAQKSKLLQKLTEDKNELVSEWALGEISDSDIPEKRAILEDLAKSKTKAARRAGQLLKMREVQ